MTLWRALLGLLPLAGLSWDDLKPQGAVAAHDHPFLIPDTPTLVQLAEALGGGIYPGMGSGQNDTISAVDSVAPGFPLNLAFLMAANQVKLQAVRLSFQPQAFRTYYSATQHTHAGDQVGNENVHTHGGDVIQTLAITINAGTGHRHKVATFVSSGAGVSSLGRIYQIHNQNDVTGQILSADGISTGDDWWSDVLSDTTGGGGTSTGHSHTNTSHTHAPGTTGAGASHAHTPGTTGANNPTTGVQEGTSPDNMRVIVDGTDVTTQLGGPFNAAVTELDITPYVAAGTGQHVVQVTTATQLGRIAGWIRHKSINNNLSPAN